VESASGLGCVKMFTEGCRLRSPDVEISVEYALSRE
jgi:hypothetical protein